MYAGIAFIFWIAAPQVTSRSLSAGSIVALVGYMTQTLLAVGYIANLIIIVTRGVASTHRVMEVLDTAPGLSDDKNAPITLSNQELSDGRKPPWGTVLTAHGDDFRHYFPACGCRHAGRSDIGA